MPIFLEACRFCEHVNPPDAKFCNACGGALHLVPCSRCGAVNDVTATSCYQCHGLLPGHVNGTPEVPQPAAEPPKTLPRPHTRAIVGAAIFAAVVVAGYFGYHQALYPGAAQPPDASSRVDSRRSLDSAGAIPRDAIAGDMAPGKRDDSIRSVSAATAQPKVPLVGAGGGERVPPRLLACTETVAALGLCTLKPVQEMGTRTTVTLNPVIARSEAGDAGKSGQQEVRQQEACTDGATALGLCTPRPKREVK